MSTTRRCAKDSVVRGVVATTTVLLFCNVANPKKIPTPTPMSETNESPSSLLIQWLGKSKTAARRTMQAHLQTLAINTHFSDARLEALVQFHPSRSFPRSNVVFVFCARPPYFTKSLFVESRAGGGLVDCSWVKCIENLYGKYSAEKQKKTRVMNAFRNEAFLSAKMQAVREKLGNRCARCEQECRKLVVDHAGKPFVQILDEFIAAQGVSDIESVRVRYTKGSFRLRARAVSKAWRAFHDAEADLTGLCAKCNCSLGARGYKRKAI